MMFLFIILSLLCTSIYTAQDRLNLLADKPVFLSESHKRELSALVQDKLLPFTTTHYTSFMQLSLVVNYYKRVIKALETLAITKSNLQFQEDISFVNNLFDHLEHYSNDLYYHLERGYHPLLVDHDRQQMEEIRAQHLLLKELMITLNCTEVRECNINFSIEAQKFYSKLVEGHNQLKNFSHYSDFKDKYIKSDFIQNTNKVYEQLTSYNKDTFSELNKLLYRFKNESLKQHAKNSYSCFVAQIFSNTSYSLSDSCRDYLKGQLHERYHSIMRECLHEGHFVSYETIEQELQPLHQNALQKVDDYFSAIE